MPEAEMAVKCAANHERGLEDGAIARPNAHAATLDERVAASTAVAIRWRVRHWRVGSCLQDPQRVRMITCKTPKQISVIYAQLTLLYTEHVRVCKAYGYFYVLYCTFVCKD